MLTTIAIDASIECKECSGTHYLTAVVDRFKCLRCSRIHTITPERWEDLFAVAVHAQPYETKLANYLHTSERLGGAIESRRDPIVCAVCDAVVPVGSIDRASSAVACGSCGSKLLVRSPPPQWARALHGMTLIGEDLGRVKNADDRVVERVDGLVASCPSCGGNLDFDETRRAVQCKYCKSAVVLPAPILERFERESEPFTFYLLHDDEVPRASVRPDFHWKKLTHAVSDGRGGFFGLALDADHEGDGPVVFAMDASLQTRWVQPHEHEDPDGLAFGYGSRLLVWGGPSHVIAIDPEDGSVIEEIERRPDMPTKHLLDLRKATAVAIDPIDGSLVFTKSRRLARCDRDGNGIPIWPPHKGFLGFKSVTKPSPFTQDDAENPAPRADELGDYPARVLEASLAFAPDGRLFVWGWRRLTAYDRAGKKIWTAPIDVECLCVDEKGIVYARVDEKLVRIDMAGKVTPITEDVPSFDALVPGKPGTIVGLGRERAAIWTFSTDGDFLSGPDDDSASE